MRYKVTLEKEGSPTLKHEVAAENPINALHQLCTTKALDGYIITSMTSGGVSFPEVTDRAIFYRAPKPKSFPETNSEFSFAEE